MKNLDFITKKFLTANTVNKMKNLLEGILTDEEIETIYTRFKIIKLLKRGFSQHAIAKQLNVGVATVSRGAHELNKGLFKYI